MVIKFSHKTAVFKKKKTSRYSRVSLKLLLLMEILKLIYNLRTILARETFGIRYKRVWN